MDEEPLTECRTLWVQAEAVHVCHDWIICSKYIRQRPFKAELIHRDTFILHSVVQIRTTGRITEASGRSRIAT